MLAILLICLTDTLYRTLTGISIFCLANRNSAWFTRIFGENLRISLNTLISFDCHRWRSWKRRTWNVFDLFRLELCWVRRVINRSSVHTTQHTNVSVCRHCHLHASPSRLCVTVYFWHGYFLASISFCACYVMNTWNAQNFPFLSQALFYENGTLYDQLSILDNNFRLDPAKLAEVVRLFCRLSILTCLMNSTLGTALVCPCPDSDENWH